MPGDEDRAEEAELQRKISAKLEELQRLDEQQERYLAGFTEFLEHLAESSAKPCLDKFFDPRQLELIGQTGRYGYVFKPASPKGKLIKAIHPRWVALAAREWMHGHAVGHHDHIVDYHNVFLHRDVDEDFKHRVLAAFDAGMPSVRGPRPQVFPEWYFCIVLENMDSGTVQTLLNRKLLQVSGLAEVCRSVAAALAYMHKMKRTHNDIKPDNVLLKSIPGTNCLIAKLADLGGAEHSTDRMRDNDLFAYSIWCMGLNKRFKRPPALQSERQAAVADLRNRGLESVDRHAGLWEQLAQIADGLWKDEFNMFQVRDWPELQNHSIEKPSNAEAIQQLTLSATKNVSSHKKSIFLEHRVDRLPVSNIAQASIAQANAEDELLDDEDEDSFRSISPYGRAASANSRSSPNGGTDSRQMSEVDRLKELLEEKSRDLMRLEAQADNEIEGYTEFLKSLAETSAADLLNEVLDCHNMEVLGRGNYGYVLSTTKRSTGERVVLKVQSPRWVAVCMQEYMHGSEVGHHENIVDHQHVIMHRDRDAVIQGWIVDAFDRGTISGKRPKRFPDTYVCIVLEYMDRGTVTSLMDAKLLNLEGVAAVTRSIASALGYMHSKMLTHNDIKPDNILLKKQPGGRHLVPKLADLGLAQHGTDRTKDREQFAYTVWCMGLNKRFSKIPPVEERESSVAEFRALSESQDMNTDLVSKLSQAIAGVYDGQELGPISEWREFQGCQVLEPRSESDAAELELRAKKEVARRSMIIPSYATEAANAVSKLESQRVSASPRGPPSKLLNPAEDQAQSAAKIQKIFRGKRASALVDAEPLQEEARTEDVTTPSAGLAAQGRMQTEVETPPLSAAAATAASNLLLVKDQDDPLLKPSEQDDAEAQSPSLSESRIEAGSLTPDDKYLSNLDSVVEDASQEPWVGDDITAQGSTVSDPVTTLPAAPLHTFVSRDGDLARDGSPSDPSAPLPTRPLHTFASRDADLTQDGNTSEPAVTLPTAPVHTFVSEGGGLAQDSKVSGPAASLPSAPLHTFVSNGCGDLAQSSNVSEPVPELPAAPLHTLLSGGGSLAQDGNVFEPVGSLPTAPLHAFVSENRGLAQDSTASEPVATVPTAPIHTFVSDAGFFTQASEPCADLPTAPLHTFVSGGGGLAQDCKASETGTELPTAPLHAFMSGGAQDGNALEPAATMPIAPLHTFVAGDGCLAQDVSLSGPAADLPTAPLHSFVGEGSSLAQDSNASELAATLPAAPLHTFVSGGVGLAQDGNASEPAATLPTGPLHAFVSGGGGLAQDSNVSEPAGTLPTAPLHAFVSEDRGLTQDLNTSKLVAELPAAPLHTFVSGGGGLAQDSTGVEPVATLPTAPLHSFVSGGGLAQDRSVCEPAATLPAAPLHTFVSEAEEQMEMERLASAKKLLGDPAAQTEGSDTKDTSITRSIDYDCLSEFTSSPRALDAQGSLEPISPSTLLAADGSNAVALMSKLTGGPSAYDEQKPSENKMPSDLTASVLRSSDVSDVAATDGQNVEPAMQAGARDFPKPLEAMMPSEPLAERPTEPLAASPTGVLRSADANNVAAFVEQNVEPPTQAAAETDRLQNQGVEAARESAPDTGMQPPPKTGIETFTAASMAAEPQQDVPQTQREIDAPLDDRSAMKDVPMPDKGEENKLPDLGRDLAELTKLELELGPPLFAEGVAENTSSEELREQYNKILYIYESLCLPDAPKEAGGQMPEQIKEVSSSTASTKSQSKHDLTLLTNQIMGRSVECDASDSLQVSDSEAGSLNLTVDALKHRYDELVSQFEGKAVAQKKDETLVPHAATSANVRPAGQRVQQDAPPAASRAMPSGPAAQIVCQDKTCVPNDVTLPASMGPTQLPASAQPTEKTLLPAQSRPEDAVSNVVRGDQTELASPRGFATSREGADVNVEQKQGPAGVSREVADVSVEQKQAATEKAKTRPGTAPAGVTSRPLPTADAGRRLLDDLRDHSVRCTAPRRPKSPVDRFSADELRQRYDQITLKLEPLFTSVLAAPDADLRQRELNVAPDAEEHGIFLRRADSRRSSSNHSLDFDDLRRRYEEIVLNLEPVFNPAGGADGAQVSAGLNGQVASLPQGNKAREPSSGPAAMSSQSASESRTGKTHSESGASQTTSLRPDEPGSASALAAGGATASNAAREQVERDALEQSALRPMKEVAAALRSQQDDSATVPLGKSAVGIATSRTAHSTRSCSLASLAVEAEDAEDEPSTSAAQMTDLDRLLSSSLGVDGSWTASSGQMARQSPQAPDGRCTADTLQYSPSRPGTELRVSASPWPQTRPGTELRYSAQSEPSGRVQETPGLPQIHDDTPSPFPQLCSHSPSPFEATMLPGSPVPDDRLAVLRPVSEDRTMPGSPQPFDAAELDAEVRRSTSNLNLLAEQPATSSGCPPEQVQVVGSQVRQMSTAELRKANNKLRSEIEGLQAELERRRTEVGVWGAALAALSYGPSPLSTRPGTRAESHAPS